MDQPLVSVVTNNFRNALQAVKCVESFLQQSVAEKLEIIVVDNHSNDDSVGILRARLQDFSNVHIVETPYNLGFGGGYNAGVRIATGKYLLINNPDKILEETAVEKLVQKIEAEPDIGILAPKLVHPDGSIRTSARALPRPFDLVIKRTFLRSIFSARLRHYLQTDEDPDRTRDVDWVIGGSVFLRRDLYEELGGFDDRFFLFFEDTDLCRRVAEKGKRIVYFPEVSGSDKKRRLSDGSMYSLFRTKIGRTHLASSMKYFAKWGIG